jgi:hypothetical protein
MRQVLSWIMANYVKIGGGAAAVALTTTMAVLSGLAQQPGWVSRWIGRVAAFIAGVLLLLAALLVTAKVTNPGTTRPMPIAVPIGLASAGVLIIAVLAMRASRRRTILMRRLRPLVTVLQHGLDHLPKAGEKGRHQYVSLQLDDGRDAVQTLGAVRRTPAIRLLSAASGAGKTTILLETARRGYYSLRWRRRRIVIPVYIDLTHLSCVDPPSSFRAFVLEQMFRERTIVEQFEEMLGNEWLPVSWLFLFDNVDQLPTVTTTQGVIRQRDWLGELAEFLWASPGRLYGVLAGRHVPEVSEATTLRVSAMDPRRRIQMMKGLGLSRSQMEVLSQEPTLAANTENPGWLSLVAPLLVRLNAQPTHAYELMSAVIDDSLSATTILTADRGRLVTTAQAMATALTTRIDRGTEATVTVLAHAVGAIDSSAADDVDMTASVLVAAGLGESRRTPDGQVAFDFRHESIRSFLAAARVLSKGFFVAPPELVFDERWTTVTVALLQAGPAAIVAEILEHATRSLRQAGETMTRTEPATESLLAAASEDRDPPTLASGVPFVDWPLETKRLLNLLATGLRQRPELINSELSNVVDRLVAHAFLTGSWPAQAAALNVLPLAGGPVAAAAAALALRSPSGWLVDLAVAQVSTRPDLFPRLPMLDRIRYLAAVALAAGRPGMIRPRHSFDETLRLASIVGNTAAVVYLIWFGIPFLANFEEEVRQGDVVIVLFVAAISALVLHVVSSKDGSDFRRKLLRNGVRVPVSMIAILAGLAILELFFVVAGVLVGGSGSDLRTLASIAVFAWPLSVLVYLAVTPHPQSRDFAFPFFAVVGPVILEVRNRVGASRFRLQSGNWLRRIIGGRIMPDEPRGSQVLLFRLERIRTYKATSRFLASLYRQPWPDVAPYYASLVDLYRALEWMRSVGIRQSEPLDRAAWGTAPHFELPGFRDWLERYHRRKPKWLPRLAKEHQESLARFLAAAQSQASLAGGTQSVLSAPTTEASRASIAMPQDASHAEAVVPGSRDKEDAASRDTELIGGQHQPIDDKEDGRGTEVMLANTDETGALDRNMTSTLGQGGPDETGKPENT